MKPPVDITALMEEWVKDSPVNETEPSKELIKVPQLHSKYLRILTHHNLIVKKLAGDYARLKKIKLEYYSGDLNNEEDLARYKLEPLHKKILRPDIPTYIDSDPDLNNILLKKSIHEEVVSFCQSVLKEINNRSWQLRSYIDWEKFIGGQ